MLLDTKYYTEPLLKKLDILKLKDLIRINKLKLAQSIYHKQCPTPLQSTLKKVQVDEVRNLRRNITNYEIDNSKKNYSFSIKSP